MQAETRSHGLHSIGPNNIINRRKRKISNITLLLVLVLLLVVLLEIVK